VRVFPIASTVVGFSVSAFCADRKVKLTLFQTDPFDGRREGRADRQREADSLKVLQGTARDRRNVVEQLIEAVKYNSLGQISHALYDVGGEYRRNM